MQERFWRKLQKQTVNNQYHLEEFLGCGGYGAVYKADEIIRDRLIREVAIKLIISDEDATKAEKQINELTAAVNLQHKNLIRSYTAGSCEIKEDEYLFIVMEIATTTLEKQLKAGKLSITEVTEIVEATAAALNYLHQSNPRKVHRDIKPANLLYVKKIWKLSDLGLLREISSTNSLRTQDIKGTPAYVPPESYQGVVGTGWDMWSLGIMTAEILTGTLPFTGNTDQELMKKIMEEQPEIDWSKIPEPFTAIVRGCLEKERGQRWTAEQVLTALKPPVVERSRNAVVEVLRPSDFLADFPFPERSRRAISEPQEPSLKPIPIPSPQPNPSSEPSRRADSGINFNRMNQLLASISAPIPQPKQTKTFQFQVITVNNRGETIKTEPRQAEYFSENLGRGVSLEMVQIPSGTFMMGSPDSEESRNNDESPQHRVTVPTFFAGKYAITQAQWKAVMGNNPSRFKGEKRPVEKVSWHDAVAFCQKLSQTTGKTYRLFSEAEWEYACRAGTTTPFHFGETITPELVNYDGNYSYGNAPEGKYRQETTDVGSFSPNAFGLYDMHGNVYEWCSDKWHSNYDGAPTDGSSCEIGQNYRRLLRGGSWYLNPRYCRSAIRYFDAPDLDDFYIGFRVVCVAAWTS